ALAFGFLVLVVISTILVFYVKTLKTTKNILVHQNEVIIGKNREAEIQNQNLEKLISENQTLMGVLAHDLRAPFSKLIGLVNILEDDENEEEKTLYINFMKGICKDALQLIQDTVNISQIYNENAEELKQKMELFKPSELLENSLNTFKAVALEKQISISFADSTTDIELRSSKEYLCRIFDNLISNAIKFSPANTNITLTSSKMSDKLVFSFKDEGPGFTEADKKQMFTRFKKLSARPTGNEVSSGLGLFIVKQLVDLIGAKIYLITDQGKGSEFLIELQLN
ncbi:MAG: HAMP domain-containing histidine kinase, partial [Bacteroidia bacterium]|nr:HAMP domain-containing histidine kinase [Bacteroidia bacterium]